MTSDEKAADAYLQKAIRELRAENVKLRAENNHFKMLPVTWPDEWLTGNSPDLGQQAQASLLVLRGALYAATAEVGKLRAENERLTELVAKLRAEIELVSK